MRRGSQGRDAPPEPRRAEVARPGDAQQHPPGASFAGGEIQPPGGHEGGLLHRPDRPPRRPGLQRLLQRPQRLGLALHLDQDQAGGRNPQGLKPPGGKPAPLMAPGLGRDEHQRPRIGRLAPLGAPDGEGRRRAPVPRRRPRHLLQPQARGGKTLCSSPVERQRNGEGGPCAAWGRERGWALCAGRPLHRFAVPLPRFTEEESARELQL